MQVLELKKHHALLALRLSAQLLHFNVNVRIYLLEEQNILRVKVRFRVTLYWFILLSWLWKSVGRCIWCQVARVIIQL